MPTKRKSVLPKSGDVKENGTPIKKVKISHPSHRSEPGILLALGQGDVGQLGLGEDYMERKRPTVVPFAEQVSGKIVDMFAGGMHTICITENGEVYTFGCNDEGALGRDTGEEGSEFNPGKVELPEKVVQVSGGDSHSAALTETGAVYIWGTFRDGNGPFGLTLDGLKKLPYLLPVPATVLQISSGNDHLTMLTDGGDIYTVGCGEQGQLGRIAECFSMRGGRKGLGLMLEPALVIRPKVRGQGKVHFEEIWCTPYCTFARVRGGGIYGWGLNNYHHLGIEDNKSWFRPVNIGSFSHIKVKAISGGQHHTILLDSEGTVHSLGRTDYGRLGRGEDCEESHEPGAVESLKDEKIDRIAAGSSVSLALTDKGEVYSWGMGSNLQLGTGDEDDVLTPEKMGGKQLENRKVIAISAGGQHTLLLAKDK